jgi:hypothetical protein
MEVAAIVIAVIGVVLVIVVPEVRRWLRLDKDQKPVNAPKRPAFRGELASFEGAKRFDQFILDNEGQIVFIDTFISEENFDGSTEGSNPHFVLYDSCFEPLCPGEQPSPLKCNGISYNIVGLSEAGNAKFYKFRGQCGLYGYFAVLNYAGPHQGLMACTLKALSVEDAI